MVASEVNPDEGSVEVLLRIGLLLVTETEVKIECFVGVSVLLRLLLLVLFGIGGFLTLYFLIVLIGRV